MPDLHADAHSVRRRLARNPVHLADRAGRRARGPARRPTTTRRSAALISTTYSGSVDESRKPLRCPTVKRWTPSCRPSTWPSVLVMTPPEGAIGQRALDEARVVAVGNEADLLAVRLVGDGQAAIACVGAHVGLRQLADRERRAGELRLRQREEEVRLVLRGVARRAGAAGARSSHRPRRGRSGRSPRVGAPNPAARSTSVANFRSLLQCAQGIGVRPAGVLGDEVVDDGLAGTDARGSGRSAGCRGRRHAPGVVQVVERAAAAERVRRALALVVELHRQADHVVAGVLRAAPRPPRNPRRRTWRRRCGRPRWIFTRRRRPAAASAMRSFSTTAGSSPTTRSTSLGRVAGAEAEADGVVRPARRQVHRLEHVRRLERSRRAGRSRGDRHALEIERDEQRLGLDARRS